MVFVIIGFLNMELKIAALNLDQIKRQRNLFIVKGQGINLRLQAELSLANKLV